MASAKTPTAPDGFHVVPYPDSDPEKPDHALFVCDTCYPQFDTFDRAVAEAHPSTEQHRLDTEFGLEHANRTELT